MHIFVETGVAELEMLGVLWLAQRTARANSLLLAYCDPVIIALLVLAPLSFVALIRIHEIWLAITIVSVCAYAIIDERVGYVFDLSLLPILFIGTFRGLISTPWQPLGGLAIAIGMFGIPWFVTRGRGMGLGDVKLALLLGALLGPLQAFVIFGSSFVFGACYGMVCRLQGRLDRGASLPFVPFMFFGCCFCGGIELYAR